ncbi:hypothetical protein [Kitasatospora sp. NPDC097691]|uniref:hypothetical protein n=1 Tax=Kitasatospora sp. NPDC097691 TaxID=3157231 RepID=UPI003323BE2B
MNRDDPAFDADDMGALFREVLDQPEPAVPPGLLPEVRRSGTRMRRRRHLLATVATALAVGLLATAGWAVHGRAPVAGVGRGLAPAASGPVLPSATPSRPDAPPPAATGTRDTTAPGAAGDTAAAPGAPSEVTTAGGTAPPGASAVGSARLLALVRDHPPQDIGGVARGTTADAFVLTRKDGGTVTMSRSLDGPSEPRGGTTSPCESRTTAWGPMSPDGRDCVGTKLADGSVVWMLHPLTVVPRGQEAEIRVVTPNGLVYILLFARAEARAQPDDVTVPLLGLMQLAEQPGFLEAVRDGWADPALGSKPPVPSKPSGPSTNPSPSAAVRPSTTSRSSAVP